jgi:hypothetical protein
MRAPIGEADVLPESFGPGALAARGFVAYDGVAVRAYRNIRPPKDRVDLLQRKACRPLGSGTTEACRVSAWNSSGLHGHYKAP